MKKSMIKVMTLGAMMVCMAATPVFAASSNSQVTITTTVSTSNGNKKIGITRIHIE